MAKVYPARIKFRPPLLRSYGVMNFVEVCF